MTFTADDLMFKPGLMDGQRILITGGGTGLGKVMAEACLMLGAEVYICGRRGGVLDETARELMNAHGGKVVSVPCDIRVPEAIAMHEFEGSVDDALALLRRRMQDALDGINGTLAAEGRLRTYPNPFRAG